MKKKVAFYLPTLDGGGAERVVVNVLNQIVSIDDIDFVMVVNKKQGVFVEQLSSEIPIYELKTKRMRDSIPALLEFLKKEQPDVLIPGMLHVNLIAIIANQLSKYRAKIIVTEHSNLSSFMKYNKGIINNIIFILIKKLYPKADRIISVSEGVKSDLSKYVETDKEKMRVIYNPVISDILYKKALEKVEHEWIKNKKIPVILAIGRLTDAKDFGNLIHAFAIVKNKMDARLIILGEGEERNNLENLVKRLKLEDSVDLYRFEKNPYRFLSNSDMYVLSSKYEGLPTVLIEALALKSNIVSTDCPSGPKEILKNGKYGRLVPIEDSELLAEAMLTGLNEPMNHSTDKELDIWMQQFESTNVANNYLSLIREIL